jgi:hypothetical protein
MGLPRTFVGFSSTDANYYRMMLAWKANEHIDFDFCDCQLDKAIRSEDEAYIKSVCRARLDMAGTFIQLIGADTRYKYKYVRWEAEVALEKQSRIIGVNLDGGRFMNPNTCPPILRDAGVTFVSFSPHIVAHAIKHARRRTSDNWIFGDEIYQRLGYVLVGDRAERPPRPFPFR